MSAALPITTEAAARAWIAALPGVSRETMAQLDAFTALTTAANQQQNLVAASTLGAAFWCRHILDSAQLLTLAPENGRRWIDLGSGAGLPGLVIAIIAPQWQVTLVEARRLRCDHLLAVASELGLEARVTIHHGRVEALPPFRYDVISARAFGPLERLLQAARHLAGDSTRWLLPKGKKAAIELSTLPLAWQRCFHVEPSVTDAQSGILVGHGAMRAIVRSVPRSPASGKGQTRPPRRPADGKGQEKAP